MTLRSMARQRLRTVQTAMIAIALKKWALCFSAIIRVRNTFTFPTRQVVQSTKLNRLEFGAERLKLTMFLSTTSIILEKLLAIILRQSFRGIHTPQTRCLSTDLLILCSIMWTIIQWSSLRIPILIGLKYQTVVTSHAPPPITSFFPSKTLVSQERNNLMRPMQISRSFLMTLILEVKLDPPCKQQHASLNLAGKDTCAKIQALRC